MSQLHIRVKGKIVPTYWKPWVCGRKYPSSNFPSFIPKHQQIKILLIIICNYYHCKNELVRIYLHTTVLIHSILPHLPVSETSEDVVSDISNQQRLQPLCDINTSTRRIHFHFHLHFLPCSILQIITRKLYWPHVSIHAMSHGIVRSMIKVLLKFTDRTHCMYIMKTMYKEFMEKSMLCLHFTSLCGLDLSPFDLKIAKLTL